MDLIDRINNTRFLGREFLTWLWFRSDKDDGLIRLGSDDSVELWFDDKLVLAAADAAREQNTLKGETPTQSPEAKLALRMGKKVVEAKLRVIREQRKWSFGIKADTLALSGVKIPALLSREEDDQQYERFDLVEELNNILLGLYRAFIELRLDKDRWAAELESIRHWIHQD